MEICTQTHLITSTRAISFHTKESHSSWPVWNKRKTTEKVVSRRWLYMWHLYAFDWTSRRDTWGYDVTSWILLRVAIEGPERLTLWQSLHNGASPGQYHMLNRFWDARPPNPWSLIKFTSSIRKWVRNLRHDMSRNRTLTCWPEFR